MAGNDKTLNDTRICRYCGQEYDAAGQRGNVRYCSDACRRKQSSRKNGAYIAKKAYEDYTANPKHCMRCGEAIPYRKTHRDDLCVRCRAEGATTHWCKECGKFFYSDKEHWHKYLTFHLCSAECRAAFIKNYKAAKGAKLAKAAPAAKPVAMPAILPRRMTDQEAASMIAAEAERHNLSYGQWVARGRRAL